MIRGMYGRQMENEMDMDMADKLKTGSSYRGF